MAALDGALVGHPETPPMCWRMNRKYSEHYDDFAGLVKRGLPKAQEKEKVTVEVYLEETMILDQWPLQH